MSLPARAREFAAKDFLSILDLSHEELRQLIDRALTMKRQRRSRQSGVLPLAGKHVALLFEKPSLRTRITFVIAVRELGGEVIEPPPDVRRARDRRGRRP
jgi:ornithine carbamoyltransferase